MEDHKAFCLSRFPEAKSHELDYQGVVCCTITLDGGEPSILRTPFISAKTAERAWERFAGFIRTIEEVKGRLVPYLDTAPATIDCALHLGSLRLEKTSNTHANLGKRPSLVLAEMLIKATLEAKAKGA